jgi:hypothetical protein
MIAVRPLGSGRLESRLRLNTLGLTSIATKRREEREGLVSPEEKRPAAATVDNVTMHPHTRLPIESTLNQIADLVVDVRSHCSRAPFLGTTIQSPVAPKPLPRS